MRRVATATALLIASLLPASAADPVGEWMVEGGYARVRIENCQDQMWGIVAWEKQAGTDRNNPDVSKRDRPTLGLPILLGMASKKKPGRWDGEIYNTENGKVYQANISLVSDDVMRVEGCVLGFLCGGQNWDRYKPTAAERPATRTAARSAKPPVAATDGPAPVAAPLTASNQEICAAMGVPASGSDRGLTPTQRKPAR